MSEEPAEVAVAASARVFGTTELLEAILYELGTSNASHSCYYDGIEKMRTLLLAQRQALFLKPLPGGSYTKDDALAKYGTICVNPLVPQSWGLEEHKDSLYARPEDIFTDGDLDLEIDKKFRHPSPSWRRMLPTHPFVKKAFRVTIKYFSMETPKEHWIDGPTWGEVTPELVRASRKHSRIGAFTIGSLVLDDPLYDFDERLVKGAPDLERMVAHANLKEKSRKREAEM